MLSLREMLLGVNREEEAEKEIRRAYNLLFTSPHGQKVLAHMLVRLHFFDEINSEEERVLSNYAKDLLNTIGVWQGINVDHVVQSFLKAPLEKAAAGEGPGNR